MNRIASSTSSGKMIIGLRAFALRSQMAGWPFAWTALPGTQYVLISATVKAVLPSQPTNEPRARICSSRVGISAGMKLFIP